MSFASYTLGIDLGVASIGWACVSEKDRQLAAGVRIFPAGIDKMGSSKEGHKNEKRRSARGARRRFARKAKRKRLVRDILTGLGWIPSDPEALQEWESLPVYELRHRALSEKISLAELARIILHLNQRRGFLSLRKSEMEGAEGEEKKELEGILGSMDALQRDIDEGGFQTLGNYLHHLYRDKGLLVRLRGRYIRRQMLYHEFDLIWIDSLR